MLKIAKSLQQSFMEDTWDERIPIECSTPKMRSCIGKEIEKEQRRNSISLATGFKRKLSPQGAQEANQRVKYNSIGNLLDEITMSEREEKNKSERKVEEHKQDDEEDKKEAVQVPTHGTLNKTE